MTEADELARWFPSRAEIELRPGGTIKFSGDPNLEDSTGRVIAVDEPRHLSFEWGGDELHFDLEALDEGRTRFTLTNVLVADNAAARNGAGWEVCLAALDAHARGERFEGPHAGAGAPWKEFYDGYVAAVSPPVPRSRVSTTERGQWFPAGAQLLPALGILSSVRYSSTAPRVQSLRR